MPLRRTVVLHYSSQFLSPETILRQDLRVWNAETYLRSPQGWNVHLAPSLGEEPDGGDSQPRLASLKLSVDEQNGGTRRCNDLLRIEPVTFSA